LEKLNELKTEKKEPPYFQSKLVDDVTFDIRSDKTLLEYYSSKAEDKDGGKV
jgi:hypothetical protein